MGLQKQSKGSPIIHIGFPRCASTFLQKHIFPKLLSTRFITCAETQRIIATTHYQNLPKDLLFFQLGNTRYVYSNEGILQFCYREDSNHIRSHERELCIFNIPRIFRDYGDILVVIRRQDSLVESLLRFNGERYRGKLANMLAEYGNGVMLLESFDYHKWIMRIADQLGKDRIHILVYEDLVYRPEKFFKRLSRILGEDVTWAVHNAEKRENESPKQAITLPLATVPLAKHLPPTVKKLVHKVLEREIRLHAKDRVSLMCQFRRGNELLSREFRLGLSKYGYY
jgi:hypothetical protein